ncbi:MAG TPA: hypothetical protein VKB80_26835 [Kofleriaceae bacterium]|nr:hypothetical protein [Kofleriaceae bacterium]
MARRAGRAGNLGGRLHIAPQHRDIGGRVALERRLKLLATEARWGECRELVDRLIASEHDRAVRARYAYTAALLRRDELGRPGEALRLLWFALESDPGLLPACAALEEMLRARGDWEGLAQLYCRRLSHLDGEARDAATGRVARDTARTHRFDGVDEDDAADDHGAAHGMGAADGHRAAHGSGAYHGHGPEVGHGAGGGIGTDDGGSESIEGRAERLRLWAALGELCWNRLGQPDDAITALAVACRLAPDDSELLRLLAERCEEAGPAHTERAIASHHKLLARNRRRAGSYRALVRLYARAGMERHARAINEALAFAAMSADSSSRPRPRATDLELGGAALTPEMWTALLHPGEDLLVSAMAALLAPVVAGASAERRKRAVARLGAEPLPAGTVAARVLARVAASLGMTPPETLACTEARVPLEVRVLVERGAARPVLILGGPLLQGIGERELAFHFGRALASLRGGGLLRWVMPRAERLGLLLDAAAALGGARHAGSPALTATIRSLERALTPVQREQLAALGWRLARRAVPGVIAARAWLEAHDLSLARAGLVACGDLSTALAVLAADPASPGRSRPSVRELEMVWSSSTPELLSARAHVEAWSASAGSAATA